MSFTEGSVLIDVDMMSQTRPKVTTRSTRQGEISRAITGQPVNSLLPKTLIESLYALCPQAHLTAFECAMAAAQQKEIPQRTRKVVYEIINEHLRFLAFDACVSVGLKPAEEVRRLGQLSALTTAELSKEIPDFDRLDEAIAPAIQTFVTGSSPDQFEALQSLPDFEAWMMHGATAASRLYAQLWETVPCRRHTSVAMLNPRCSLETIETWISGDVSVSCPLINGIIIGASRILRSIFNTYSVASQHRLFPDALLDATHLDTRLITILDTLLHAPRAQITIRASRKTDCHGIIFILIALHRHLRYISRGIRLIIRIVFRRFIIRVGVHTEYGKITGMPRPHPVIRIATELTDRARRSENHTHVTINIVHYQEIFIIAIERNNISR